MEHNPEEVDNKAPADLAEPILTGKDIPISVMSDKGDDKELEDPAETILSGKDIPISLTAQDDPTAPLRASSKSPRVPGNYRPVTVKAEIKILILDPDILDVEKIIDFTYKAYRSSGSITHTRRGNIRFVENGATNPSTVNIPAGKDQTTILVGIRLPTDEEPGTFYASIVMEINAAKPPDYYVGHDEILVRFDYP
jgi:hypothetical protein